MPAPPPLGAVDCNVYLDRNGNGVRDPDDPGIPDVTVRVSGTNTGNPVDVNTTTDPGGICTPVNLSPGNYDVTLIAGVRENYRRSVPLVVVSSSKVTAFFALGGSTVEAVVERSSALDARQIAFTGSSSGLSVLIALTLIIAGLVVLRRSRGPWTGAD